MTFQDSTNL